MKKTIAIIIGGIALASMAHAAPISLSSIPTAEEIYHEKTGDYLQVLPNNILPAYEDESSVSGALGGDLPQNVKVNTYEMPDGQEGYFVQYSDSKGSYSVGYGPMAKDYTWTYLISTSTATTT